MTEEYEPTIMIWNDEDLGELGLPSERGVGRISDIAWDQCDGRKFARGGVKGTSSIMSDLEQIMDIGRPPHRVSQGDLDLIRIRNGDLEDGRHFYESTWKKFKEMVRYWQTENRGWWNKNDGNYQEGLASNLKFHLRNGDRSPARRNESMRIVMGLFDDIEDSPFRRYLMAKEDDEQ